MEVLKKGKDYNGVHYVLECYECNSILFADVRECKVREDDDTCSCGYLKQFECLVCGTTNSFNIYDSEYIRCRGNE